MYQHSFLAASDISCFNCQLVLLSWVHLFYSQGVLEWNKTLVMMVRLVLGCSRYQLFKLPVIFTLMRSFSTTELFQIGLQVLVVSWMCPFTAKVFWGGYHSFLSVIGSLGNNKLVKTEKGNKNQNAHYIGESDMHLLITVILLDIKRHTYY